MDITSEEKSFKKALIKTKILTLKQEIKDHLKAKKKELKKIETEIARAEKKNIETLQQINSQLQKIISARNAHTKKLIKELETAKKEEEKIKALTERKRKCMTKQKKI